MSAPRPLLPVLLAIVFVTLTSAGGAPAAAAERVVDGGFDAATCTASDCTSSAWSESATGTQVVGPICSFGMSSCTINSGGFRSPSNWARLAYTAWSATSATGSVEQSVAIPAAPATLTFWLRIHDSNQHTGQLAVTLDGAPVRTIPDSAGFSTYQPVTVDVGSFAGGQRMLRFAASSTYVGTLSATSDGFEVDDVSLDAADAAPGPPPGTCNDRPATITGTDDSELLEGTSGPDVIAALGGNDIVKGGPGKDIICGGAGSDELRGESGKDRLLGDRGKDKLKGGGGRDTCDGGGGKDKGSACERGPDS